MSFLNPDSDFMQGLTTCVNYILLNVLCFLCCMPIITIGASLTAKYYVSMKLVRGEEPALMQAFFKSFKENFKQSTLVWLLLAAIMLFLGYDWYVIHESGGQYPAFYQILLCVVSVLTGGVFFTVFPLIARFYMSVKEVIRAAAVFTIVHLIRVVIALFVMALPYVLGIWYVEWALALWLFITGVALYYNSRFFVKNFDKIENVESGKEEAEDHEM